jgi:putative phage-type endonuclease
MSFTVIDALQRSPEWFAARVGLVTGSRAADVVATIKSGEAAARRDYRLQIVTERLTGVPQEDGYTNAAMQWGIDHEAEAFAAYEAQSGLLVTRTGFLRDDERPIGCSLDGHIGAYEGVLEVKCPKSSTHLSYLRRGVVPVDYYPQIAHNLLVTGAAWCDFVSFDPRFPPDLQVFVRRILRGDVGIPAYTDALDVFLSDVAADLAAIEKLRTP